MSIAQRTYLAVSYSQVVPQHKLAARCCRSFRKQWTAGLSLSTSLYRKMPILSKLWTKKCWIIALSPNIKARTSCRNKACSLWINQQSRMPERKIGWTFPVAWWIIRTLKARRESYLTKIRQANSQAITRSPCLKCSKISVYLRRKTPTMERAKARSGV